MTEAVVVALITGGLSLLGTVLAIVSTSRKSDEKLRISQAVTDTKLDALTREVRAHNNFAARMPIVEEQIKVINHRLNDLERIDKA